MYADKKTTAIENTLKITKKRRKLQEEYNSKNNITPKTIKKEKIENLEETFGKLKKEDKKLKKEKLELKEVEVKIKQCKKEMKKAAKEFRFEDAAHFRDLLRYYEGLEIIG